jgi:hypothetical protein
MRLSWYAPTLVGLALALASPAHAERPTAEDVGDADSFGRNVVYLGVASTGSVLLQSDCTPDPNLPPEPQFPCVTLLPPPQITNFNEDNLAAIRLPARATRSLICFSITSAHSFGFANDTDVRQNNALFRTTAMITVESEVLNDPTLIDPNTGLPFGGRFTLPFGTFGEFRTIDPGERASRTVRETRDCIGGLLNRASLLAMGLSEAQVARFFRRPMRIVFGLSGGAAMVDGANLLYGVRLYGDR